ncbi:hypothetical protein [Phytomonospora endophytica]|uniref:Uncharacterized protein n=1 Tax=Phytomonospora endophytica TaxID=714109 RepID=A0A841FFE0_9ACTN|nr:hypothetical protein [Phytomonospora endophytica]MBB6034986.1 hypothetical protein [Phytomonospora endophytica]GIG71427.1 hypothetical protein Pen01_77220 [Phytomonospora endophytica]
MAGEVGIRSVHDAGSSGRQAETAADGFKSVRRNFDTFCDEAGSAANEGPMVRGIQSFQEDNAKALQSIATHGRSVGENIQGGTGMTVNYDTDIADGYRLITPKFGDARYKQLLDINR